jgi:glycosyltransferase involved in cell wall biosynthesis
MVIVYVLTSLGMGGAERQVLALATRMADRGHAVKLLVLRPRLDEEWPTPLPVLHLNMRRTPASVFKGLVRARRFLLGYRPQLLHSHSFHANLVARLLRILAPPQVVSTIHNVYEGSWVRMLIYRITDGLSRRTTAVSAAVAERFVRMGAVPRRKCVVVPNGIDSAEFAPNAERREQMRSAMGVGEEFIWLTAGRIVPAKDFPNLLRAFAQVRRSIPEAQLWIAGEGNPNRLKRASGFALVSGSLEQVRWLGLRRDLPALLDAADGFVLASEWEGMPLVVGEAMAMGKPVVATDVGGVRELMGNAGVLVPAVDSNALAAAMVALMRRTAAERQALGRAARARITTDFSIEARVDQWETLYRSVLTRRR